MEALVGVGSNLAPEHNVPKALRHLGGLGHVLAASRAWRTPPHGPVEGGPFLNAAVHLAWHGDLDELRHALKRLERAFGRGPGTSLKARPLDLDVLAVREKGRKGWTLIAADLADQPYVLRPLAEVAPTLSLGNRTVADLAKAVPPEDAQVVPLPVS